MDQSNTPTNPEEQRRQDEDWAKRVIEMEQEEQAKMKSLGITIGIIVGIMSLLSFIVYMVISLAPLL